MAIFFPHHLRSTVIKTDKPEKMHKQNDIERIAGARHHLWSASRCPARQQRSRRGSSQKPGGRHDARMCGKAGRVRNFARPLYILQNNKTLSSSSSVSATLTITVLPSTRCWRANLHSGLEHWHGNHGGVIPDCSDCSSIGMPIMVGAFRSSMVGTPTMFQYAVRRVCRARFSCASASGVS